MTRVGVGHLERDALGRLHDHRVAEAERQAQRRRALRLGAIADADDLELLGEAVGDTDDHVADERAGEAVQRTVLPLVVRALDDAASASSRRTVMSPGTSRLRVPFGPLTVTDASRRW